MAIPSRIRKTVPVDQNTKPLDGIKEESNISTEPLKSKIHDTARMPASHLIMHGAGSPMEVVYYRGLNGQNDPMDIFDNVSGDPSQQYEKINKLIIKVTSPITPNQDTDTKVFEVSGEGRIEGSVIPNVGDVFLSYISSGVLGLFSVTVTERKSYNKLAVYEVSYGLVRTLTEEDKNALDEKTVRSLVFVPVRAAGGEESLLTEDDFDTLQTIRKIMLELRQTYPDEFLNHDLDSVVIPDTGWDVVYDVFLVEFLRNTGLIDNAWDLTTYDHPPHEREEIRTIWWRLQSKVRRGKIHDKMVLRYKSDFDGLSCRGNIAWSNATFTVFPKDIEVVRLAGQRIKSYVSPHEQFPRSKGIELSYVSTPEFPNNSESEELPVCLPLDEEFYVFSEAFYTGTYASLLEYGLMRYLNDEDLSTRTTLAILKGVEALPPLERFYYTPAVSLLLNYAR